MSKTLSCVVMTITPFDEHGAFDEPAFRRHLQRLRDAQVRVYVGSSASGEGFSLTEDELDQALTVAVEELKGALRKAYATLMDIHAVHYKYGGAGSGVHLASELFLDMAGIKILHVPYKGTAPAVSDTVAGHVQSARLAHVSLSPPLADMIPSLTTCSVL